MSTEPPRGIRNNNYLNIKNVGWDDANGKTAGTDPEKHAVFTDPAYGVRAGIIQLRTYYFRDKLRTIADILAHWAPASDTLGSKPGWPKNSPVKYASFVAGRMGIGATDELSLFNPDKSIGDAKQLRALFYAMAEYELGQKDQVPDEVFDAGLALVRSQTVAAASNVGGGPAGESALKPPATAAPQGAEGHVADGAQPVEEKEEEDDGKVPEWTISAPVGRWDKGAINTEDDVETVQEMLRHAAMDMKDPKIDPGDIDGEIARAVEDSATVGAIVEFQSRFMNNPDGLIEVGGRTWRELLGVVEGQSRLEDLPPLPTGDTPKRFFPLATLPTEDWTKGMRCFGARRSKGRRAHAACDLYRPMGTTVYAVADGRVLSGPDFFYLGTWALVIDHGDFLVRYGEVQPSTVVSKGDRVKAGQPIAKVGRLNMLHFELYSKKASGSLTVLNSSQSRIAPSGRPFYRRKDLIDPSPLLDELRHNLPGGKHVAPKNIAAVSSAAAASIAAAKIPSKGFCIHLKRTRQEKRSSMGYPRTVGEYQCYWNGAPLDELKGQFVERGGPGDNTTAVGNMRDLRITEGTYRLSIHEGSHYKTYGYRESDPSYENRPNPGLLLMDTRERKYILIHPGEDYVKSVGCLNPATGLSGADAAIDFSDSRRQVISMIEGLKSRLGDKFPKSGVIPDASIVIEGEPA